MKRIITIVLGSVFLAFSACNTSQTTNYKTMEMWETDWGGTNMLTQQPNIKTTSLIKTDLPVISINPATMHQPILGFGATFTDSDIYNFMQMGKEERTNALKSLFDPINGAGWNLMRISFGSSDWDRNWDFYTYDDMPKGEKDDAELSHFSIEEDRKRGHFELIHEALAINPDLKIFAAVWGPPAWMKDNDKLITDGTIVPEHYNDFALYLVKAVQAYKEEGIDILSVSPQNEVWCIDGRLTPQALYLDWKPMRDMSQIIKEYFTRYNLNTEVWIFDHNFIFTKEWVLPFISDSANSNAFDAVAWHDYEGDIKELCELSKQFPNIPMYHTEKALYTTRGMSRILQIIRCGARSHNHWVTISDEFGGPHQFRGGSELRKNPQTDKERKALYNLKDDPDKWFKTPGYYTFAQLSKFVKRDAVLIESNDTGELLTNAAFKNPDGSIVLVVSNSDDKEASFIITVGGRQAQITLPADAAGTYIFK